MTWQKSHTVQRQCVDCFTNVRINSNRCHSCANKAKWTKYGCTRLCVDCQKPLATDVLTRCISCDDSYRRKLSGSSDGLNDRPLWGGCHEWTGQMFGGRGARSPKYFDTVTKNKMTVRRVVWECLVGEIPEARFVRTTCGNYKCIWVGHLTLAVNMKGAPHLPGDRYPGWGGYVLVAQEKGRAKLEHVLTMEEALGRSLYPGENVHHINGVKDDNTLGNLELWATSQPSGQRVEDILAWAHEMIKRYETKTEREESVNAV